MTNLPPAFSEKYQALLGPRKAAQLFAALEFAPQKAYRINSLKAKQTISYEQTSAIPAIHAAFYGQVCGTDPEWVSGTVYSQEPAAMFPAMILNAKAGEKVLDLCAAPGGKSTALAEQLHNQGLLVANEISAVRAQSLRANMERWGASNVLLTNESPVNLGKQFPQFFDKILVDAPCSGEGMFRKNQVASDYWSPAYVLTCQKRQQEILREAVKMLRPGGELVYSTCTFAPEEDEQIIAWLVKEFGFTILPIDLATTLIDQGHPEWADQNADLAKTVRFWPFDGLGEGQFVAKLQLPQAAVLPLRQKPSQKRHKTNHTKAETLTKEQITQIAAILAPFNLPPALSNWTSACRVRQEHVFLPALTTTLHVKTLNNGVEFGLLKKKRFEPGHQLALVLSQVAQTQVIDLTPAQYAAYLHGEALRLTSSLTGFVLVSCQHMIFSFGKLTSNGILKNFYPKGLRTVKKE